MVRMAFRARGSSGVSTYRPLACSAKRHVRDIPHDAPQRARGSRRAPRVSPAASRRRGTEGRPCVRRDARARERARAPQSAGTRPCRAYAAADYVGAAVPPRARELALWVFHPGGRGEGGPGQGGRGGAAAAIYLENIWERFWLCVYSAYVPRGTFCELHPHTALPAMPLSVTFGSLPG
jgi:hypothetical protein